MYIHEYIHARDVDDMQKMSHAGMEYIYKISLGHHNIPAAGKLIDA